MLSSRLFDYHYQYSKTTYPSGSPLRGLRFNWGLNFSCSFFASTNDPATGEDWAAKAECQVGLRLSTPPMIGLTAPTWHRPISAAVPQLRQLFL
jgi:hypothetical protein